MTGFLYIFHHSVLCTNYRTAVQMQSQSCHLHVMLYLQPSFYKVTFKLTGSDCIFLLNNSIRVALRFETDISNILIPITRLKCSICYLFVTASFWNDPQIFWVVIKESYGSTSIKNRLCCLMGFYSQWCHLHTVIFLCSHTGLWCDAM